MRNLTPLVNTEPATASHQNMRSVLLHSPFSIQLVGVALIKLAPHTMASGRMGICEMGTLFVHNSCSTSEAGLYRMLGWLFFIAVWLAYSTPLGGPCLLALVFLIHRVKQQYLPHPLLSRIGFSVFQRSGLMFSICWVVCLYACLNFYESDAVYVVYVCVVSPFGIAFAPGTCAAESPPRSHGSFSFSEMLPMWCGQSRGGLDKCVTSNMSGVFGPRVQSRGFQEPMWGNACGGASCIHGGINSGTVALALGHVYFVCIYVPSRVI